MAKQNPNINYTSGSSIINVKGTIVKAITVNDPSKYSAGQPVDPNSKDPLIKNLIYTIDGGPDGTGKVKYFDGTTSYDSLNDYAKSPAVYGAGYTTNTTKAIQTAMQKNLATAISTSIPIQPSAQNPNPGGTAGNGILGILDFDIKTIKDDLQFGSVDENLKINLQYPKDALYNKTQDHLQIGQFHYQPPKSNQLFNSTDGAIDILTNGLQKTSALKKFLGIVKLPMPNNVNDSNNVSWGDDNMNNLSAAATAEVIGNLGKYVGAAGLGALTGAGTGTGAAQVGGLAVKAAILSALGGGIINSKSANALFKTGVGSQVLSMGGFSVSPESILARGFGVVPNSNLELLFNSPTLREFTFQYRMSPRSKEEATDINKIIRFFKQGMAAKKQDKKSGTNVYGSAAGASSYFLGTPNVFQLQYKTSNGNPIKGVNRIKTCALVGFSMNYTADGTWAAYDDGQPVSVIMNMSFKELEPIYDTDYQTDIFDGRNADKNPLGDLYPISPNDVGY
jgi:hypothetical protein